MPISNEELVAIIKTHRANSYGVEDSDLSNNRALALDRYHGRPYGDEEDGKSQIVSRDLSETLDWVMAPILKTLFQSGNLIEFTPANEDDIPQAQQESDYVNHVIMHDNDGFLVVHDAVKDTLLLRNGYFRHYWDESESIREVEYEGLTQMQLAQLFVEFQNEKAEVDIIEQEERVEVDQNGQQYPVFDVKLKVVGKKQRIRLEAAPSEDIRVSKRCKGNLQESPFTEYLTDIPRSDLLELGMDEEFVDSLPAIDNKLNDTEKNKRGKSEDDDEELGITNDRSMDYITFCEAFIRVDFDGDGKAELRRVITVADRIPPGKEWNEVVDSVGMSSMISKRMPHRHVGESLYDDLCDLTRIKTFLERQMLDNTYSTTNAEWLINERANIDDFLQSIAGGLKRVTGTDPVDGAARALDVTPIIDKLLPVLDYVDRNMDKRTGIDENSTQISPDVLKATTEGAFLESLNRSTQKVEMYIRMIVETGVKEVGLRIHELARKHQDIPRTVKLRGNFVEVNPTNWMERTDLTVKVGLGTGTEQEKRQELLIIGQQQTELKEFGLITPEKKYNYFKDVIETLGRNNPEKYALDPQSPEYAQIMQAQQEAAANQPNPLAEAEQVKGQAQMQIEQLKGQFKQQSEVQKLQFESQLKLITQQNELNLKAMQEQMKANIEQMRIQSNETIAAATLEIKAILEGRKLDLGKPGIGEGLQDGQ